MTKLQELGFNTTRDGLVVAQQDGDVGDGPQRTSFAHLALIMQGDLSNKQSFLYAEAFHWLNSDHKLVRDTHSQWNDPKDISRDQLDPYNIVRCIYAPLNYYLLPWLSYPSLDIAGPQTWALNIRALKLHILYPLLPFLDLQILVAVAITCLDKNPEHVDDDNLIARLCQAILIMPTPTTWLARKIYSNYRDILGAIGHKHRIEAGGNPTFVSVWAPVIRKYFRRSR